MNNIAKTVTNFNLEEIINAYPVVYRLHQEGYFFLALLFVIFAATVIVTNLISILLTSLIKVYTFLRYRV